MTTFGRYDELAVERHRLEMAALAVRKFDYARWRVACQSAKTRLKLSTTILGRDCGVKRQRMAYVLRGFNGSRMPVSGSIDLVLRMCARLGLDVREFFG